VPLIPLNIFNGALSDSNKVDMNVWRMNYSTLLTARINGSNPIPGLSTVNTTITSTENSNPGVNVITTLYADINYLRPDAITSNLLSASNNQLYDVSGRSQSPYYSNRVFAASPTVGYAMTGTPSFIFSQSLFFNASTRSASSLYIDFGDGTGYHSAQWNTAISANYTAIGSYTMKMKIIFTDNSVVECYSPFYVGQLTQTPSQPQGSGGQIQTSQYFPAKIGIHSGGTAYFQYNSIRASNKIVQPLIVVKGYDLSDAGPKLGRHYGFIDFLTDYDFEPGSFPLSTNITQAGYDIIYVDYNNSLDDITHNAAYLQDVITWVNAQKATNGGTQKNIVLGISMGGLVARYCLANMTKQSIDPQTSILFTQDSPHQGANLPLGMQALIRAINETAIAQAYSLGSTFPYNLGPADVWPINIQAQMALDATATQQMLILHANNGEGSVSTNTFLNTTYRNMITFPPTGPQPTYKVEAMALGSECGIGSTTAGSRFLTVNGNFFISPVPWISRLSYNTNAYANALPAYGPAQQVSNLHIWINERILLVININIDLTNKSANSPANTFPWDGVPGGIENLQGQYGVVGTGLPSANASWGPFFNFSVGTTIGSNQFCFVPVVSALDVTTINSTALSAPYVGGISPTDPARVANFIAQEVNYNPTPVYNSTHANFTPRNSQWLYQEIVPPTGGNNINCSTSCSTSYAGLINGPLYLCTSGTYTLNNLPSGASLSWSSNNTGLSINGTTGVATQVNNWFGGVNITANITTGCGLTSPNIPIWVGHPNAGGSLNKDINNPPFCVGATVIANINTVNGATGYSWVSGNPNILEVSGGGTYVNLLADAAGTTYFTLTTSNTCGSINKNYVAAISSCSGGGGQMMAVAVYPNPAASSLTVSVVDSTQSLTAATLPQPCQIILFNKAGQKMYSTQSSNSSTSVPLSGLPADVYYVNVVYKQAVRQKQIVIQH